MQKVYLSSANQVVPATGSDQGREDSELDALAVLRTIWRGKWLVAFFTLLLTLLGAFYVFVLAVPQYTATAVVTLQNRDEQVVDLQNVVSGLGSDQTSINTEVEVLRSRGLIERVVDRLDLMNDPEFNAALRPVDPWSPAVLVQRVADQARGMLGLPVQAAAPQTEHAIRTKTMDAVTAALRVDNIRQTYVFEITVTTNSPVKSARIADTLADLYILDQLEVKFQATEQATEWLSERVAQLKQELEYAENAVKSLNAEIELISPERLELLNRQLKEFRDRRTEMVLRQQDLEARVALLEAAEGDPVAMEAAAGLPPGQLGTGQTAERRFSTILARARLEADRGASQIETMSRSIDDLTAQVGRQSQDLLRLEQLQREAEASRTIYEYFLGRLKETAVQQGVQQADSRVLSAAVAPLDPSEPRKGMVLVACFVLGAFLGALVVLLLEMRNVGFRTPEELERSTGTVVIGQVPRAPHSGRKKILDYVANNPTSAMVEAVRNLRTSILLSNLDRPTKVIMLTSSVPGEGKTTMALSLAHNLATMGRSVLVIEGDLRRRTLREVIDSPEQRGVVSAVVDETPIADLVHRDPKIAFDVLLGERLTVNAADFFSSDRFADFLQRARDAYDFVVIDTPPVLLVPDARVIGQMADVVVYVVHWDKTPRTQVQQGLHSFQMVNVPVSGMVLSQIDPKGMRRYGYTGAYGRGYGTSKSYYNNA